MFLHFLEILKKATSMAKTPMIGNALFWKSLQRSIPPETTDLTTALLALYAIKKTDLSPTSSEDMVIVTTMVHWTAIESLNPMFLAFLTLL
jgi:hypothetical protein